MIKLIKQGWTEHLEAYKKHVIDQALTILTAGHDIKCMFATPKLLEQLCLGARGSGHFSWLKLGVTGIFSGGTEFTPQWTRFAVEELIEGIYMTPTYGNTLMGLAASRPVLPEEGYKISYYAPQPRAVLEVVQPEDPDSVVGYGETGRVRLTTLTKELFVPGFLERDEGERELPYVKYPVGWSERCAAVRRTGSNDHGGGLLMLKIDALRWGKPYSSLETSKVVHFESGEELAEVSQTNPGLVARDMRKAFRARELLRAIPNDELIERVKRAGELYTTEELPLGRWHPNSRRFREVPVGNDRSSGAHVPVQYGKEPLCSREHGRGSRFA